MNRFAKLIALFACIDAFAQPLVYPLTKTVDEQISAHGVSVPDPYRWLENIDDPQVKEWRSKQNELAMKFLGDPSTRSKVSSRLQEIGAVASKSPCAFLSRNDSSQADKVTATITVSPNILIRFFIVNFCLIKM